MPFYKGLDENSREGLRTIDGLLRLRELMAYSGVPRRGLEDTLLLATWNLREFEDTSWGERLDEAYYYIAEILSHFDLISIQEVRPNVRALDRLVNILGGYWKYLVSDVTKGSRGNRERIAFMYDSRKLHLGGIAGEVVIAPEQGGVQLARTPYLVGFKAGWTRLMIGAVHILWGSDESENVERVAEIDAVARELEAEAKNPDAWTRTVILLGDFNIFSHQDATMQALLSHGFVVPDQLIEERTNLGRNRAYDQIAFHKDDDRLRFTGRGGSVPYFDAVFRDDQAPEFAPGLLKADGTPPADPISYYKRWRTYQLSDHLPLWIELKIDNSDRYLRRKYRDGAGHDWPGE